MSPATLTFENEDPAFIPLSSYLPSPESPSVASDEHCGKVYTLTSPASPEKNARTMWTIEETQMLVKGCNQVSASPPFHHPLWGNMCSFFSPIPL